MLKGAVRVPTRVPKNCLSTRLCWGRAVRGMDTQKHPQCTTAIPTTPPTTSPAPAPITGPPPDPTTSPTD
ncbi:hypothetical protein GCM10027176_52010 [Actinoallomurus bryophytorum]